MDIWHLDVLGPYLVVDRRGTSNVKLADRDRWTKGSDVWESRDAAIGELIQVFERRARFAERQLAEVKKKFDVA